MKKFIALSLSMVAALSLAGCGGGSTSDSGDKDEGGESSGKTEISAVVAQYGQNTAD